MNLWEEILLPIINLWMPYIPWFFVAMIAVAIVVILIKVAKNRFKK